MSFNVELARTNMVDNQVRTWDVLDLRVLTALDAVHRDEFVADAWRNIAFADTPLPLGHGEVMLKPVVVGRLLQGLLVQEHESVLEIGTGSGYLTACLGQLAADVTSIEQHADLADAARARLQRSGVANARVETAEALHGWRSDQQFDAVVVTGAVWQIPATLLKRVKPGGRLLAVVGESPAMQAQLHLNDGVGIWTVASLFETDIPYLNHAQPPQRFVL